MANDSTREPANINDQKAFSRLARAPILGAIVALALVLLITVLLTVVGTTYQSWQAGSPIPGSEPTIFTETSSEMKPLPAVAPAGKHHQALADILDHKGVENPSFKPAAEAGAAPHETVIGVLVDNQAFAFPIDLLSEPTSHVVNLQQLGSPLLVTYCNITDCIRVLSTEDAAGEVDLRVGGLDVNNSLVLMLNGERYGHTSSDLPLQDFAHERATLEEWLKRHPKTLVYCGPQEEPSESDDSKD